MSSWFIASRQKPILQRLFHDPDTEGLRPGKDERTAMCAAGGGVSVLFAPGGSLKVNTLGRAGRALRGFAPLSHCPCTTRFLLFHAPMAFLCQQYLRTVAFDKVFAELPSLPSTKACCAA